MVEVEIRKLKNSDPMPYELLLDADPSKKLIDEYLPFSEIHVAESDGKIIGVCVLFRVDDETVEIKNIAVREDFQGRGIGKQLLRNAEQWAIEKQFKTMIIGTGNSSTGQLYLYQKEGFEISEIKKNFFTENYPEPLFENRIQVKHMIVLMKSI